MRGAELAAVYYARAVRPLLDRHWPELPHAAGRWGAGSDVLGLDDEVSRDHDWGLRLTLLVPPGHVGPVDEALAAELPAEVAGHPARFATTSDPTARHRVEVSTVAGVATARLGLDATGPWDALDWLSLTGQAVLEVTAGPVLTDTAGELTRLRERLTWYPDEVWRHVVACDWVRLQQELPFVGRTAERGDDLGSRLITARLARVAVHLGFLLERTWPPYAKWTGTLFDRLPRAGAVGPLLSAAVRAERWPEREAALVAALEDLLGVQRAAGLPAPERATEPFHDRPYRGVADDVVARLRADLRDPQLRALPPGVGSLEQCVDNVDVLVATERRGALLWAAAGGVGRAPGGGGGDRP
ncbi:DUF4037 domain-containing protein [Kineococcus rubinsiae]|uniref:DUF4037 domain-containing protein n=1 Tax=Kineococcus rubinsiae TaxID=2609562 RepID=UPI001430FFB0|nr:DUF4037 domain-containing protein [Kineococcus rubinsiae]NIZ91875.1 DUF4037 domain-containing protein [Kineococcus rubinsiae]